jgi:protoporphyrinogen oxidase
LSQLGFLLTGLTGTLKRRAIDMSKSIILGAGFAGMAAAIKTGYPIYEASPIPGGICGTYYRSGFQFSTGGGHWIFGKGKGLDYIKSQVKVNEYERIAGIYYNHTFPYPVQTTAQKEIVSSEGSLKRWLSENFSKAECNLFFHPFNDKYTAGIYDDIIQSDEYKTPPAGGVGFVPTFGDPEGGLGTLVDKMAKQCQINYNKKAIKINTKDKVVTFSDGEEVEYEKIISTIPLNKCLEMCGESNELPYTSVLVVNIGAERTKYTPKEHWLYIPFSNSNFYRLGFYSNIEQSKAPEGKVSLSAEMAFHNKKYEEIGVDKICADVVEEIQKWNFIGDVIEVDPTWVECAYTWLYKLSDRDDAINKLKQYNITSIGRYGKWKFQGMVQSIEDGLSL